MVVAIFMTSSLFSDFTFYRPNRSGDSPGEAMQGAFPGDCQLEGRWTARPPEVPRDRDSFPLQSAEDLLRPALQAIVISGSFRQFFERPCRPLGGCGSGGGGGGGGAPRRRGVCVADPGGTRRQGGPRAGRQAGPVRVFDRPCATARRRRSSAEMAAAECQLAESIEGLGRQLRGIDEQVRPPARPHSQHGPTDPSGPSPSTDAATQYGAVAQRNNALQHRRAELTQELLQVRQALDAGRGEAAALAVEHADLEALAASGGRDLRAREAALAARRAALAAAADEVAALEAGFERFCADFQRDVAASAGRKAEGGARREAEARTQRTARPRTRVPALERACGGVDGESNACAAAGLVEALKDVEGILPGLRSDSKRHPVFLEGAKELIAVSVHGPGLIEWPRTLQAENAIGSHDPQRHELVLRVRRSVRRRPPLAHPVVRD